MDFTITKELLLALSKLSTSKSSGTDTVTAEMLKSGKDYLIDPLLRLVNYVFSTGIAPDVWNESLLTPIYKNRIVSDRYHSPPRVVVHARLF